MGHRKFLFAIGEWSSDGSLEVRRFGCGWFGTFAEPVEEDLRQRWAAAFLFFFGFGRKEFALAPHVGRGELESVEDDARGFGIELLVHEHADYLHDSDLYGGGIFKYGKRAALLGRARQFFDDVEMKVAVALSAHGCELALLASGLDVSALGRSEGRRFGLVELILVCDIRSFLVRGPPPPPLAENKGVAGGGAVNSAAASTYTFIAGNKRLT